MGAMSSAGVALMLDISFVHFSASGGFQLPFGGLITSFKSADEILRNAAAVRVLEDLLFL